MITILTIIWTITKREQANDTTPHNNTSEQTKYLFSFGKWRMLLNNLPGVKRASANSYQYLSPHFALWKEVPWIKFKVSPIVDVEPSNPGLTFNGNSATTPVNKSMSSIALEYRNMRFVTRVTPILSKRFNQHRPDHKIHMAQSQTHLRTLL